MIKLTKERCSHGENETMKTGELRLIIQVEFKSVKTIRITDVNNNTWERRILWSSTSTSILVAHISAD